MAAQPLANPTAPVPSGTTSTTTPFVSSNEPNYGSDGGITGYVQKDAGGNVIGFKPSGAVKLNANFGQPTPSSVSSSPATIVDSGAAEEHLGKVQSNLNQLGADTNAQSRAAQNAGQGGNTPQKEGPSDTKTPGADAGASFSLDKSISDKLDALSAGTEKIDQDTKDTSSKIDKSLNEFQTQHDQDTKESVDKLKAIAGGTYPLSESENALLAATAASFTAAIAAQTRANAGYEGKMTEFLSSNGIDQSAPTQAFGIMHAAISAGAEKIGNLEAKMNTAIANLHEKLQAQDYKEVLSAEQEVDKVFKERATELQKMQTQVEKAGNDAKTALRNQTKDNINALINSGKFTETQKKNAVDKAYKSGLLNAKEYANYTARMREERLAGGSGGTTTPPPEQVQKVDEWLNKTRGTNKYVDPTAYQQAFDTWIASGYSAKNFVKNYPPKLYIDPANTSLPSYLSSKLKASSVGTTTNPFK